jgi:hypothetical protein
MSCDSARYGPAAGWTAGSFAERAAGALFAEGRAEAGTVVAGRTVAATAAGALVADAPAEPQPVAAIARPATATAIDSKPLFIM